MDGSRVSHVSACLLYTQDIDYFPGPSSVMHGPVVVYRIILPLVMLHSELIPRTSNVCVCVCVCMNIYIYIYIYIYIKTDGYGAFRFIVHILYHSIIQFHTI